MGFFLSLVTLSLVGGVLYVLPANRPIALEQRVRRPLAAIVSGLGGYVLLGLGLIPVEKVLPVAGAIHSWLPYEVVPAVVSLLFAGAGLLLVGGRSNRE